MQTKEFAELEKAITAIATFPVKLPDVCSKDYVLQLTRQGEDIAYTLLGLYERGHQVLSRGNPEALRSDRVQSLQPIITDLLCSWRFFRFLLQFESCPPEWVSRDSLIWQQHEATWGVIRFFRDVWLPLLEGDMGFEIPPTGDHPGWN